jgi:hypothetical protein
MIPAPFDGFSALSAAFPVIFTVVFLIVVAGFAFTIYSVVRNAKKVSDSGHDPITLQSDLAIKVLESDLLAGSGTATAGSIEERLRAVDDLFERKVISEPEHAAARAAIIAKG